MIEKQRDLLDICLLFPKIPDIDREISYYKNICFYRSKYLIEIEANDGWFKIYPKEDIYLLDEIIIVDQNNFRKRTHINSISKVLKSIEGMDSTQIILTLDQDPFGLNFMNEHLDGLNTFIKSLL